MTDAATRRPLDLSVAEERKPPYGIVDIGSNSVRLVVYDQLGRAPLPRFNEKSLCRLGEGLARDRRASRRTISAAPSKRRAASPPSPRRWHVDELDVTATEAIRRATNGPELAAAIERDPASRCACWPAPRRRITRRSASSPAFSGRSARSATWAAAASKSRWRSTTTSASVSVSLPLGALPVEAMLARGREEAKREVDERLRAGLPMTLAKPTFFAVGGGWRALAKAHMTGDEGRRAGDAWLCAAGARRRAISPSRSGAGRRSPRRRPACSRAAPAACPPPRWRSTAC